MKFTAALLCAGTPALVLALPPSGASQVVPRQSTTLATVVKAELTGDGCPPNSWTFSQHPENLQNAVIGLDKFLVQVQKGTNLPDIPSSEREKRCDIAWYIQYPVGCTMLDFQNRFDTFVDIAGELQAKVRVSYVPQTGSVTPNTPQELVFKYTQTGDMNQLSVASGRIEVPDKDHSLLKFTVSTRGFVEHLSGDGGAVWQLQSLNLLLMNQRAC